MSDRSRVILIFVVIGLIAGGGGFYFFKIYRPAQDLKNAQAEIVGWETRFQAARDCLLGKTPGSSKTSEALAIREMAPDPWDRGKCTPLISKLSRGSAPDTGIPAVETAWAELDKTATKAALAFARHVSESTTLKEDPLPAALDELDAARDKLRASASLKATETTGKPLPAAQIIPVGASDGAERVTRLVVDTIPSAHGIVLFGSTESRSVQITLTAGAAPKLDVVGPRSIRSAPDTSWGAVATDTDLRVGAFDKEGVIATPTTLTLPTPIIAAVVGSLADGTVAYGNQTDFIIAKAKGGVVTAGAPTKIKNAYSAIDVDGRAVIVWGDDKVTKGQIFKLGAEDPAVELPPADGAMCLTSDRAWVDSGDLAIAFGGGKPVFKKPVGVLRLQGCTAEAAVFHDEGNANELLICTDDCRTAKLPAGAPQYSTITVVGGKLIAIASHGGVLGVWREGAQPAFSSLPVTAKPVMAHEWPAMALTDGKVIDVLARGDKGFNLVRIPAN